MGSAQIPMAPIDDSSMEADAMFASRHSRRCCCCILIPESWQRIDAGRGGDDRRWWSRMVGALMKVREWSELVAGPRWKTFIRRFNRNRHQGGGSGGWGRMGSAGFQYDPLSYALNFDEGPGGSSEGEYTGYRDFSARFVAPPASAKSSMDLGGRDAPPLFAAAPSSQSSMGDLDIVVMATASQVPLLRLEASLHSVTLFNFKLQSKR
ncbi:hypothetical protein Cni_G20895 [Canna indica]|uniref:NHL repeat-containing protein n=1 Tax=Canna indica TaxID=4628 RepID=A0AAQ3KP04_9LILI|nr:hypothetical protein Cni_G20895 [Canna indica]